MYQNYSREALIELVEHQQRLLDHRSEPFFTCPPTILCPQDMSKASHFLDLFSKTLKAAKEFDKEIDISAWLSKKEHYNVSDANFFYHLAFNNHSAFNKAANDIFTPYINKANADNKSYSDILHFFDTCLEQIRITESVVSRLLDNIKKISNHKERYFFEKYIRDSIISSPNHSTFININKNNPDILNLKEHPESLAFFNFTRNMIDGLITSRMCDTSGIINAVVNTGVFDNDIFDAYNHKNTLMEGKAISTFRDRLCFMSNIDNGNTYHFDNVLLERLEIITRDTRP